MDKDKKPNSKRSSKIVRPVSKRTVGTRTAATPLGNGRCCGSTAGSTPRSTGCSTGCSRMPRPARSPPPVRTCPGSICHRRMRSPGTCRCRTRPAGTCRRRIWPLAGTRRTRRRNRTGNRNRNRTDNRNRCSNLCGQQEIKKLHSRLLPPPSNRAAL